MCVHMFLDICIILVNCFLFLVFQIARLNPFYFKGSNVQIVGRIALVKWVCVLISFSFFLGMDNNSVGNSEMVTEAGWYILGENQQHVGPYAFSELRGEL